MKVFLDTNVLLDYIGKRDPFCEDATAIFEMLERGELEGAMSSLTVVNCAYILRKVFPKEIVSETVKWICDEFHITSIDKDAIVRANYAQSTDFEDAVQYCSSQYFKTDVIITRDKKGFAGCDIRVMTPAEFVAASRG